MKSCLPEASSDAQGSSARRVFMQQGRVQATILYVQDRFLA